MERSKRGWKEGREKEEEKNTYMKAASNLLKRRINDVLKSNNKPPRKNIYEY